MLSSLQTEGRYIPLVPAHMIYTSPQTAESFSQLFDCHGDSYREPLTVESLRTVFDMITEKASDHVTVTSHDVAVTSHDVAVT